MPAPAVLRLVPWPVAVLALTTVALLVVYPPVRITSRSAAATNAARGPGAAPAAPTFAAADFAQAFWQERLQPAAAAARDAGPVLTAFREDPAGAVRSHGQRVGLGGTAYFFLRGQGRVTAVERSRVLVEVAGAVIALRTGPIFGNAVRDGTGLLEVNQVPGLAEFNALSAELNRRVEETVLPALRTGVTVGAMLTFAGCAEAPETVPATGPLLTFIPVQVEVLP